MLDKAALGADGQRSGSAPSPSSSGSPSAASWPGCASDASGEPGVTAPDAPRPRRRRRRRPTTSRSDARTDSYRVQTGSDLLVGDPVVGIEPGGLFPELFAALFVGHPSRNVREHVGIAPAESSESFGAEDGVGRAHWLGGVHGHLGSLRGGDGKLLRRWDLPGRDTHRCRLAWLFPGRAGRRSRLFLAIEDLRPVELDVGVMLFDQADRVLVDGRAPDANSGRSPEPVEDSRTPPVPAARRVDDVRRLVAALVAAEPKRGQGLLPSLRAGHRLRDRAALGPGGFRSGLPRRFARGRSRGA